MCDTNKKVSILVLYTVNGKTRTDDFSITVPSSHPEGQLPSAFAINNMIFNNMRTEMQDIISGIPSTSYMTNKGEEIPCSMVLTVPRFEVEVKAVQLIK